MATSGWITDPNAGERRLPDGSTESIRPVVAAQMVAPREKWFLVLSRQDFEPETTSHDDPGHRWTSQLLGSAECAEGDHLDRSDRALPTVSLAPLTIEHWPQVEEIYAAGIATGHATFEASPPSWEVFDAAKLPDHRVVAVASTGRVLGWTAASRVSDRRVYAGVVEHSVYVAPAAQGHGVGRLLLRALIASTEATGIWTIQSGIFPENTASLRVHQTAGFHVVGVRRRLGRMTHGPLAGQWRDVIMIERRSQIAGTD
ncbi:MAG: GNAT family N-acetyltransferase [Microlunatus sp.]